MVKEVIMSKLINAGAVILWWDGLLFTVHSDYGLDMNFQRRPAASARLNKKQSRRDRVQQCF